MIVRRRVIDDRLRRLRQVVRNLEELQEIPRDEFVASFRNYWLAERGLQLAAEAVFDVGNHVLAGEFNVHPDDYEGVIQKLADQEVISRELRERLRGLGGFRNILVHEYLEVDVGRVHDFLQEGLDDFILYAEEIEEFLERSGEGSLEG